MKSKNKVRLLTKLFQFYYCKFLFRVEHKNEEVLDKYNSYILAPNHSHSYDGAFVYSLKYERDTYVAAKKELFDKWIFSTLAKVYNVFPVDREQVNISNIRKPLEIFKNNKNAKLLIFPEGKVVEDDEEIGKVYRKGSAFLAYNAGVPIIPAYITRKPKLFSKVTVTYGEPFFIKKGDFTRKRSL